MLWYDKLGIQIEINSAYYTISSLLPEYLISLYPLCLSVNLYSSSPLLDLRPCSKPPESPFVRRFGSRSPSSKAPPHQFYIPPGQP